jgi:tetratricopeptide (TPR) repeat protein
MKSFLTNTLCALVWAGAVCAACNRACAAEEPAAESPAATQSAEAVQDQKQSGRVDEPSQQEQIAKLIQNLGDKDYFVRQRAQNELARMGFEAFDALTAATSDDDLEIASRAKYLLRLMRVQWTEKGDSTDVQTLLKDYELQSDESRRARMRALALLPEGNGILALCRLVRFEKSEALSKTAAIELLRSPSGAEPPQGERAQAIRKLFAKSSRPAAAWIMAWLKFAQDPQGALEQWNKLIEAEAALLQRAPGETDAEIIGGLIRYQILWQKKLGLNEQAIGSMRRLLDLEKGDSRTLLELLGWLVEQKAWKVIDEMAVRFAPRFDAEPILLYTLAQAQKAQGDPEKAEETAQRAFRLNAGSEEPKLINRYAVAIRLQSQGLMDWAKREYQFVIDNGRTNDLVTVRACIRLSELYHDQGADLAAAMVLEEMFKKSGANFPNNPEIVGFTAMQLRAWMYYYQACRWAASGEQDKQRECLDKALAADAENVDVLIACYRLPKQTPEERKRIAELVRKAADDLHAEIAVEPDDASLYNQYAWLVGNTEGNLDEALKYSQKSLELLPDNPAFYDTMARVYYAKGDYDNAVKNQQRAAELEPHSGLIAKQLELFKKAREEQKKGDRQEGAAGKMKDEG